MQHELIYPKYGAALPVYIDLSSSGPVGGAGLSLPIAPIGSVSAIFSQNSKGHLEST